MRKWNAPVCGLLAVMLAGACAGSGRKSDSSGGFKALDAVVTEREYNAPGTAGGGSFRSSGTWYLSFEARDGDKTVHYRFPVTQAQYYRYPEGTAVRLVITDDRLREIRPATDK